MLMHKVLRTHLLRAFVANLKIDAIYAFYPESFCDKNLAIQKVFAFSDSAHSCHQHVNCISIPTYPYLLHWVNQALVQVTGAQGQLCAIEAAVINSSIPPN